MKINVHQNRMSVGPYLSHLSPAVVDVWITLISDQDVGRALRQLKEAAEMERTEAPTCVPGDRKHTSC